MNNDIRWNEHVGQAALNFGLRGLSLSLASDPDHTSRHMGIVAIVVSLFFFWRFIHPRTLAYDTQFFAFAEFQAEMAVIIARSWLKAVIACLGFGVLMALLCQSPQLLLIVLHLELDTSHDQHSDANHILFITACILDLVHQPWSSLMELSVHVFTGAIMGVMIADVNAFQILKYIREVQVDSFLTIGWLAIPTHWIEKQIMGTHYCFCSSIILYFYFFFINAPVASDNAKLEKKK